MPPKKWKSRFLEKLEEAVATTQGLAHMESRSRAGMSEILLSFRWDSNLDQSIQDVREGCNVYFFPKESIDPLLIEIRPFGRSNRSSWLYPEPAMAHSYETSAKTSSNRNSKRLMGLQLYRFAEEQSKKIQISVREDWLAAKGITIDTISQTLSSENINMPAGSILEGDREYLVRTLNAFSTIEELEALSITKPDGTRIPLSELAEIRYGDKERSVLSRLNAQEAVELEIYKTADSNIVQVTNQLRQRLFSGEEALESSLPEGSELSVS